jgi:hypothetical protein
MIARIVVGTLSMLLLSAGASAANCPLHLVTIEPDGRASQGTKEALLKAFHAGLPLRVGWSLNFDQDVEPEVTHWSDGGFLTEFEGELFAQLADIQAQGPRLGKASISMPAKRKRWSGLIGTNGVLEGNFDDGEAVPSERVRSEWCVDPRAACAYASEAPCAGKPLKAELREPEERDADDADARGRESAHLTSPGSSHGAYGLETAATPKSW